MRKAVTILYAEDDVLARMEVKEEMEKKGWRVFEAGNGQDAYALYKMHNPDVIVLDVDMPFCSGLEVLQLIRMSDLNTPVVMYSALKSEDNVRDGFRSGANVYMIKDYRPTSLVLQVEKCINKNGDILEINNDTYYNTQSRTLYTSHGFYKLSMLENKLFTILCRNRNKLVQRSLLLKAGWEEQGENADTQLNKMINKLREVITVIDGAKIETEKGHGYWLKVNVQ